MRNLKRALSLALASVMLVGMMVVGTSAASYPDVDSNDNVEAIAVLQAVGVMQGDAGTGEFRPDDRVSRNEMAVIMARLLLGSDADDYVGTHPFTDVPAWADKYVAACYNEGIIMGMDETTYGGTSTITAEQAAAMMLRALGYEKLEGTGADWAKNVVAKANSIRLFADVGANPKAAMTRNQIAQLGLNTLESTMVNSDVEQDIIVEGVVTIPGKVTYTERKVDSEGAKNYAGSADGSAGLGTVQLCEELYGTGSKALKKSSAPDEFGRTATVWRYDNKEVGKYAAGADATYTAKVKYKEIYSDLGLSGASVTASKIEDGGTPANISLTKTATTELGGNGTLVEAYKAENGDVTICIINTYAGKVSRVTPAKDDNDRYITISGAGTFETEGFEKDDIVLYTKAGSDIKTVTLAEKIEDQTVTSFTGAADTASKITAGGTKYELSAKGTHHDNIAIDSSYDLYLDENGFVIYTELYEAGESNYAYVLDAGDEGVFTSDKTHHVKLLLTDGTIAEGKSDKDYKEGTNLIGHVVTYTTNSDGEYELTDKATGVAAAKTDNDNKTEVTVTMKPGTAKIDVSKVVTTSGTAASPVTSTVNANSSTIFVVGNKASASDKYTYTVYTGIANVPKIDDAEVDLIAASDGTIAKYVFIQALDASISSSDSDKTIFIKGATKTAADKLTGEDKTVYCEYTAMVDGEEVTLKVKDSATVSGAVSDLTADTWAKTISENKDGYITAVTTYPNSGADDVAQIKTATGTDRDGDAVKIGTTWYTLDTDAPVVVIDGDDIYAGSVTDVDESSTDKITAVVKDGKVTALAVERKSIAQPTAVISDKDSAITFTDDGAANVAIGKDETTKSVTLKATSDGSGTLSYKWEVSGDPTDCVTATIGNTDEQAISLTKAGTVTVKVTIRNTLADGQYAENSATVTLNVTKGA